MGRRKSGRHLDGIVLLNKPLGESSNGVLQRVRRLYDANKAGHTGALDPLASGMLPICFGNATKFAQYGLDADKVYRVTATLGIRTTTSDADGEVVEEKPVSVTEADLLKSIEPFRGAIKQVPSMFSALKHQGKPLYYYARQGIEIERPARDITIHQLDILSFDGVNADMRVHCSKGTYIRSLVDDIGQALGCGAFVSKLHREQVAGFEQHKMYSFEEFEAIAEQGGLTALDELLLAADTPLQHLPIQPLNEIQVKKFLHGQQLRGFELRGTVRVYDGQQARFIGIAEIMPDGAMQPKRLLAQQ